MKKIRYIIFLTIVVCFCISCEKDKCQKHYNIETHYTLSPALDTFQAGDTIWISCNIPTVLGDEEKVDFSERGLKMEFYIDKLDTIHPIDTTILIQNYQDFEFIEKIGKLRYLNSFGSQGHKLEHAVIDERFQLEFGIVPSKKGLYNITFYTAYKTIHSAWGDKLILNNVCEELVDNFAITLNHKGDNNFDFLQQAKSSGWRSTPKYIFDMVGSYCFYVVE